MDIALAMERSLTTARSEAFLRERLRELEASGEAAKRLGA